MAPDFFYDRRCDKLSQGQYDAYKLSSKQQAPSGKRQAPGFRIQAASDKRRFFLFIF